MGEFRVIHGGKLKQYHKPECLNIRLDFEDRITYLFLAFCPSYVDGKNRLMESYYSLRSTRVLPFEIKWGKQPLIAGIDGLVSLFEGNARRIGLNAGRKVINQVPKAYRLDLSIADESILQDMLGKWDTLQDCSRPSDLLFRAAGLVETEYLGLCNLYMS